MRGSMGQRIRVAVRGIAILAFLTVLFGCIYDREGWLKAPAQWPPQPIQEKKSIVLKVTRTVSDESNRLELKENLPLQEQAVDVYKDSRLFSHVGESHPGMPEEPADLYVHIDATPESENTGLMMASAWISGMTLALIPGHDVIKVNVMTTIKDGKQKVLGTIHKQETISTWIQLFLVFAMPFRDSPQEFEQKVWKDFFRATIDEAHAKGIL